MRITPREQEKLLIVVAADVARRRRERVRIVLKFVQGFDLELTMEALTYSYTRMHLAQVMRSVNEDRATVLVTTQRGKPVVIMSLDDYNALEETAYLLRSPKGAKRLMESVEQLRAGGGEPRALIGTDDAA